MSYGIAASMRDEASGRHHAKRAHVRFAEFKASIGFDGRLLAGSLPLNKPALVRIWIVLRRDELEADWALLEEGREIFRIDPFAMSRKRRLGIRML